MRFLPWRTWPDFFADNPWALDVYEGLRFAKGLWDQYESIIIVVALWLVARKIRRESGRLKERVDTLGQHVKAAGEAADTAVASANEAARSITTAIAAGLQGFRKQANSSALDQPEPADGETNWEKISDIWRDLKDRLELQIQEIGHKRVRAKYSQMPRRTYRDVINSLRDDGEIPSGVATKLLTLDHEYQVLRFRPKSATAAQLALFQEGEQLADRVLPDLPESAPAAEQTAGVAQTQTEERLEPTGPLPAVPRGAA